MKHIPFTSPRESVVINRLRSLAHKVILLLLLGTSAAMLHAEMVIPLPVQTLTAKADLVIRCKVLSTTVQRDPEGRIYTAAEVLVREVWKGDLKTNHFTVVHGGGALGDEISEVSGETEYYVGEEMVSFLMLNKRGEGTSIGMKQGKFQISDESRTGEKLVHNRFHGLNPGSPENPSTTNSVGRVSVQNRVTLAGLKLQVTGGAK